MFHTRLPKPFRLAAVTLLVFSLVAAAPVAAASGGLTDLGARVTTWIHTLLEPWIEAPAGTGFDSASIAAEDPSSTPPDPAPDTESCEQGCEDGGGAIGDPNG